MSEEIKPEVTPEVVASESIEDKAKIIAEKLARRKAPIYVVSKRNYMGVRVDLLKPHEAIGFLEEAKRLVIDNILYQRRAMEEHMKQRQIQVVKDQGVMNKLKNLDFFKKKSS
jgi:hypothetical protein